MNNDINIGFIGLGNVGSKLANSILISNYNLFVYDLDIKKSQDLIRKGAQLCSSIKDLSSKSNIIITCLPTPKAVSDAVEGSEGFINYIHNNHL